MIEVRDYEPQDHNFIISTWLRGYFYGNKGKWDSKDEFMINHHRIFENILNKPNTSIKLAVLKDDKDVALGFAIFDLTLKTLYWVYIKTPFRQNGISKSLVPKELEYHSFSSKLYNRIAKTKPFKGVTNG